MEGVQKRGNKPVLKNKTSYEKMSDLEMPDDLYSEAKTLVDCVSDSMSKMQEHERIASPIQQRMLNKGHTLYHGSIQKLVLSFKLNGFYKRDTFFSTKFHIK